MSNGAALNDVKVSDINALGATERNDSWWKEPLLVLVGLGLFTIYVSYAATQGDFYNIEDAARFGDAARPYLSPFYSPDLPAMFPAIFGSWPLSPAILILPFPMVFRGTCYYYRKAYYRSFFTTPSACAVGGQPSPLAALLGKGKGEKGYSGESKFPLIMQNLHRFTFYVAVLFMVMLTWDAIWGTIGWEHSGHDGSFHVGIGTLVLWLNVILLGLYTFGCHSWRHILGGKMDCFSCSDFSKARYTAWKKQSFLNEHHMLFAWCSLVWVGFSDIYVRLCAMGIWHDFILF